MTPANKTPNPPLSASRVAASTTPALAPARRRPRAPTPKPNTAASPTRCANTSTTPGAPATPSTASTTSASPSPAPRSTPKRRASSSSAPSRGARDAEHAVTQALVDHADEMRAVLDEASGNLATEYVDLQTAAAAFTAHRDALRQRWEEYIRANEPDGTTRGWRRDPMRGDLTLEADTQFRPRRAGSSGVLTTGHPGRTENAQAVFAPAD